MTTPRFTILLLTSHRVHLLKRALDSIARECLLEISGGETEVIVVVNDSEDSASRELLRSYPFIAQILVIERTHPGSARNRGIRAAKGEWIFFLDDDAYLAAGTSERLRNITSRLPDACVIGGPNLTPPGADSFQQVVGRVLQLKFASVYSNARFKPSRDRECGDESLMLCNLLIKRSVLNRHGLEFDAHLTCNEENLLIQQLRSKNERIHYVSDFFVYHERRTGYLALAKQVAKYGAGRAENTRLNPRSLRVFHLIPMVFAFYVLALLSSSPFTQDTLFLDYFGLPLYAYFALVLGFSLSLMDARALLLLPLVHFSYGVGMIKGILFHLPRLKFSELSEEA